MDRSAVEGKFQWRKIFLVPLLCTLLGTIVFAVALHDPQKMSGDKAPAGKAAQPATATATDKP